jgi:ABC-type phosphate/phosphonate transport system permease subunit
MNRMAHEVEMVVRGDSPTHRVLRSRLAFLVMATLALDVLGTVVMYSLEHANRRSGFHDWGGAMFWVSTQLTTVSSQLPNPVTTGGRLFDMVLQVWAVSVVATLAASLASFFLARHHERAAAGEPA